MAVYEVTSERTWAAARPLELVAFGLIVAHAIYLAASHWQGLWLIGPDGHGIPTDFVNVWAAGKLALQGHAPDVYNWPIHKAVEEAALGRAFDGYFGWHYPPTFLFAAMTLALLPYSSAFLLWAFGTFPAYLIAVRAITDDRSGYWLAAAFPAVLCNFMVGQNGFLSAALFGGALVLLERRPVLAGVLFGLLAYKPHIGLLIPIALVAGGYWRTIVAACVIVIVTATASWLAFGMATWQAFLANIGHTSQAFLSDGWADFGKLQTAFGLVRTLGGSEAAAWSVQITFAIAAAIGVIIVWRSRADFAIKAAALGAGALLATPYLYTYDLVVLAVPLAFLFSSARTTGFLSYELSAIGVVCLLIAVFPFVTVPVGLFAVLIAAGLIARRWLVGSRHREIPAPARF